MKKILIILLSLSILICSVGCNTSTPSEEPTSSEETTSSEPDKSQSSTEQTIVDPLILDLGDRYREYLSEMVLPHNFVSSEILYQLGLAPEVFSPRNVTREHELVGYEYRLRTGGNVEIFHLDMFDDLQIVELYPSQDQDMDMLLNHPSEYMRSCSLKNAHLIYYYEDIAYVYNNGDLTNIIWDRGDIVIRFCNDLKMTYSCCIEDFYYKSRIEQGKAKINAVIPIASPAPAT